MLGTVKFFNHQRGFGFIIPEDGGKDLFFHVTACLDEYEPRENDRVKFEVEETQKGFAAQNVQFVGDGEVLSDDVAMSDDEDEETVTE